MNKSDFLEFNEPEIEENLFPNIERRIQFLEQLNLWKLKYSDFTHVEKECSRIVQGLKSYEKRIGWEFDCFKEYEARNQTQERRCDQINFKVEYGWIPREER